MSITRILLIALFLAAPAGETLSQENPSAQVASGVQLYKAGEYQRSLEEKVEAYKYSAFDQIALGSTVAAKESFRQALLLAPNLTLDPTYVSPKIIAIFEEVKASLRPVQRPGAKPSSRMGFAVRSLIIPSWGQFAANRKVAGFVFLGGTALALGNVARTQTNFETAKDKYFKAGPGSDFDGLFSKYDKATSNRNTAVYLLGTIYLANVVDAFLAKPPEPRHAGRPERPSFGLRSTPSGLALVLCRDL